MTHALKTHPSFWRALEDGTKTKTFELRKDNRPFKEGDTVLLQEYSVDGGYTGSEIKKQITYILRNEPLLGLKKGFCIMGLIDKEQ